MSSINIENILKDLSGNKDDKELIELIKKFIIELENINFKSNYKIFPYDEIQYILEGENIKEYAQNSNEICVFIGTLGLEIDKKLKILEKTDKLAYLVFDRVCSHYIEEKTEILQKEIEKKLLENSKYMLNRFSTGYGDFPIDVNEKICNILKANKLGIFLTDKNMFMPSKTISGIIASGDINKSFNFCKTCNITKDCNLIKEGRKCFE